MVRAYSLTSTLLYTYNADGLRVAQSVNGDVTNFAWDWASGLPEMLSDGEDLYLVSYETLGQWDGAEWVFYLPDALGSIRQKTDGSGDVTDSRQWMPFGVAADAAQAGLGYTGEWWDAHVGLLYLRARWYAPQVGRFTRMDEWPGIPVDPLTLNPYVYALANPVNYSDPSGYQSELEKWYINRLYDWYIEDTANRLNMRSLTDLSDDAFAAMIAARILAEDATIFADRLWPRLEEDDPGGFLRQIGTLPVSVVRPWVRDWLTGLPGFRGEISWGPANMRLEFVIQNLQWWEQHHSDYNSNFGDVRTYYYNARDRNWPVQWLIGNEEIQLEWELQTGEGTVNQMALAILRTSWRIKDYYQRRYLTSGGCEPIPDLSAYMIAMGIINYDYPDDFIFELGNWTSQGFPWDWVEAMDGTAEALGFSLIRGDPAAPGDYYDYLPYTAEEKEKLESIPHE